MSSNQDLRLHLSNLIQKVDADDIEGGKSILDQIKISLLSLDLYSNHEQRAIAITALEYGVLLAVADDGDMEAFARYMAQLRPFYYCDDVNPVVNTSSSVERANAFSRKCHILGLNLMHLLVENRLSEFHAELERLTTAESSHPFVMFPIRLERQLMVGSYDEVLRADEEETLPSPYFSLFLSRLVPTVRDTIADGVEVAYSYMSLEAATQMMRLNSVEDLKEYISNFREDWIIDSQNQLCFRPPSVGYKASDVPSQKLMAQCLSYATELERIV